MRGLILAAVAAVGMAGQAQDARAAVYEFEFVTADDGGNGYSFQVELPNVRFASVDVFWADYDPRPKQITDVSWYGWFNSIEFDLGRSGEIKDIYVRINQFEDYYWGLSEYGATDINGDLMFSGAGSWSYELISGEPVAPVPLPAAGLALPAALGALAVLRRRVR